MFNNICMIRFTSEVSYITTLALWLIVSFKWKACISSLSWIQNFVIHNSPPWVFYQHKMQLWCGLFEPRKFYVIVFSHNQCYGYTMPKVTMIFTLKNLWQNLEHNFVVAFEHATSFVGSISISWKWCTWM
jgi:hypothetical protein